VIATKLKICSVCEKPSRLWRSSPKLCKNCAATQKPISRVSKTLTSKGDNKYQAKRDMNLFLAEMVERIPERCQNCDEKFIWMPLHQRKCLCAHILPKGEKNGNFFSVKTDPDNIFYLCVQNGCHWAYDTKGAAHRATMGCYELALKNLKMFAHNLSDSELDRAKKYLNLTVCQ
jgi:hypothetical protein